MHLSRTLVALPLLVLACSSPGSGASGGAPSASAPAVSKEDAALAAARSAAARLGAQVRTKLVDAMNNGGPANAIQVCSAEAQGIGEQVAKETGAAPCGPRSASSGERRGASVYPAATACSSSRSRRSRWAFFRGTTRSRA